MNTIDEQLNEITIKQLTWKPGVCQQVAVTIARSFVDSDSNFVWADEVKLPELSSEDKNVVGVAWRNLARNGIVRRLEGQTDHRRSHNKNRKGGVVWRYELARSKLLRTFLKANGHAQNHCLPVQAELIPA